VADYDKVEVVPAGSWRHCPATDRIHEVREGQVVVQDGVLYVTAADAARLEKQDEETTA